MMTHEEVRAINNKEKTMDETIHETEVAAPAVEAEETATVEVAPETSETVSADNLA